MVSSIVIFFLYEWQFYFFTLFQFSLVYFVPIIFIFSCIKFLVIFNLLHLFYVFLFFPFRDPEDRMRLGQHFGRKLGLERRDVWDMLWSEDDEEMLCIVEKTKMVRLLESVSVCIV